MLFMTPGVHSETWLRETTLPLTQIFVFVMNAVYGKSTFLFCSFPVGVREV